MTAEVVRLVNVERAKVGLPALGTFDALDAAAAIRAPELVTLFDHTRPDGTSCFTALDATGANQYYTAGENIAAGRDTPAGVVDQWMHSPGHKANILNKDFTHIGVGYAKSDSGYGHYWVQMFVGTNTPLVGDNNKKPDTSGSQKPSNGGTTPPGDTQKPSDGNITTPGDTQKPSDGNNTPGDTQKPSDGNITTPGDTQKPSDSNNTPSDTQKPSDGNNTLGDTQKPSDGTDTSSGNQTDAPKPTELSPREKEAEVVRLVNEERAKVGLAPLGTFDALDASAAIRAPELITLFSHDRPDGTVCFTALDTTGANATAYTAGENIAAGRATPEGVMEQWMNSPGHKANILNKDFTHIGVGYVQAQSGYGHYWVQMFVGTNSIPTDTTPDGNDSKSETPDKPETPSESNTPSNPSGSDSDKTEDDFEDQLMFFTPIVTLGGEHLLSVDNINGHEVTSGVKWTVETPDLLRIDEKRRVFYKLKESGTGYITAEKNGHTARLTVRLIPQEDQIHLSMGAWRTTVGSSNCTKLYVFDTSKFYGQDYTVEWTIDDPSVASITEEEIDGYQAVRIHCLKPGNARITCTVTLPNGESADDFCFLYVVPQS